MAKAGDPHQYNELEFLLKRAPGRVSEIRESLRCLLLLLCSLGTVDGHTAGTTVRKRNAIRDHSPQCRRYRSKIEGVLTGWRRKEPTNFSDCLRPPTAVEIVASSPPPTFMSFLFIVVECT